MKKNLLAFAVAVLLCAPFTVHAAEWQQEPDGCIPRSMVTPDEVHNLNCKQHLY